MVMQAQCISAAACKRRPDDLDRLSHRRETRFDSIKPRERRERRFTGTGGAQSSARFRRGVGKSIEGYERLAGRMDRVPDPVDRKAGNSGSNPAAALGYVSRGLIRPLRTAAVSIVGITVNVGHTAVAVAWRIGTIVIGKGG